MLEAHAFAKSVGGSGGKAVGEFGVELSLQRVVAGGVAGEKEVGARGATERRKLGEPCVAGTCNRRCVQIVVHDSVDAVVANVGDIENELSRERLLNREIPGFHIGILEILVD